VIGIEREEQLHQLQGRFADDSYDDRRPRVRVARSPASVLVAAHHSALDGLGLLGLLGIVLDAPVRSSVRGLSAEGGSPAAGRFLRRAAGRLREAALSPPLRIAPDRRGAGGGDHLVETQVPSVTGGTPTLLAAVARAVDAWNDAHGTKSGPVTIAVGLSRRPGSTPTLEDESAFARVVMTGRTPDAARSALHAAPPEPAAPPGSRALGLVARLGRPLSGRLGSTLLVSNLGRIDVPDEVRSIAFWPVATARSGVSLGVTSVGAGTVLGLRARRAFFTRTGAERLLATIAASLTPLSASPEATDA